MHTGTNNGPVASRHRRATKATSIAAAAVVTVSLALLTGCGKATGYHDATGGESGTPTPSPSVNPSYGTQYLDDEECAAPEGKESGTYREVPCDAPEATAQVTLRLESGGAFPFSETVCARNTDFVIDVPVSLATLEHTRPTGEGYACMRNLKPPHPGDPGGGGGPRIEIGDCVHSDPKEGNAVTEAACRTKGRKGGATHKIVEILKDQILGGFSDPCDYKADAVFTENPLIDSDKLKNERVLCGKKL
ncbi:hypothetical protein ABT282_38310 [Streptomyces sp. NPDC000927]|uniref:hypothetical protein n=1 Tax=Streptomyces sp. NPDC000927 TaxID=3154371 RepID=UPI0033255F44